MGGEAAPLRGDRRRGSSSVKSRTAEGGRLGQLAHGEVAAREPPGQLFHGDLATPGAPCPWSHRGRSWPVSRGGSSPAGELAPPWEVFVLAEGARGEVAPPEDLARGELVRLGTAGRHDGANAADLSLQLAEALGRRTDG
nr:unnamed protein product [Digitaria exilis]